MVEPFTKYIVDSEAYCMKSSAAVPSGSEPFTAIKFEADNKVRNLLVRSFDKNIKRSLMQTMIWNLTNKRHPRDLPKTQRKLLAAVGIISKSDVEILDIEKTMFNLSSKIFGGIMVNTLNNF